MGLALYQIRKSKRASYSYQPRRQAYCRNGFNSYIVAMIKIQPYHDRRRTLELSFDGPIPRTRLAEPQPAAKPANAYSLARQIAERRRKLPASQARTDEILARLCRHLSWLVRHDRQRHGMALGR